MKNWKHLCLSSFIGLRYHPPQWMQFFRHSWSLCLARLACTFALVPILIPFSGNSLTTPVLTESTYTRHDTFWTQVHSRSTVRLGGRWTAGHVRGGWESAWIRMSIFFVLRALWVKDDKCRLWKPIHPTPYTAPSVDPSLSKINVLWDNYQCFSESEECKRQNLGQPHKRPQIEQNWGVRSSYRPILRIAFSSLWEYSKTHGVHDEIDWVQDGKGHWPLLLSWGLIGRFISRNAKDLPVGPRLLWCRYGFSFGLLVLLFLFTNNCDFAGGEFRGT